MATICVCVCVELFTPIYSGTVICSAEILSEIKWLCYKRKWGGGFKEGVLATLMGAKKENR